MKIHPIRATIALLLVASTIFQAVMEGTVTPELATMTGVAVTFYFVTAED